MNTQNRHLVFFVHGLGANPMELDYLKNAMEQLNNDCAATDSHCTSFRYICDNSNTGSTNEGFLLAGERLAKAITQVIHNVKEEVKSSNATGETKIYLSMIGYSCGGNFCRSALKFLKLTDDDGEEIHATNASSSAVVVVPLLFCTIASPTLGLGHQTYFPRWFETAMSRRMGSTGHDLNLTTSVVHDMATSEEFLAPLRTFRHRIVVANAFHTDVAVPTATAAFLSKTSTYPHVVVPQSSYLLVVTTTTATSPSPFTVRHTDDNKNNNETDREMTTELEIADNKIDNTHDMSLSLDSVGWTKIFLDLRDAMPGPAIPTFSKHDASIPTDVASFTSQELYTILNRTGTHWKVLPFGHPLVVASQKHGFYKWLSKGRGRKTHFVDQLAKDFVEILRNA